MSDRWALAYPNHFERRRALAVYWIHRFRSLRREEGAAVAAGRLRKMGVPLPVALLILGIRPTRGLPAPVAAQSTGPTGPRRGEFDAS
ncbi:MAG: hypothetical protein KA200_00445 [Burkholderiales bacterium]|nr:hypothetical protein [Burkholderiales bacterium]